jgi:hypothetical protein
MLKYLALGGEISTISRSSFAPISHISALQDAEN